MLVSYPKLAVYIESIAYQPSPGCCGISVICVFIRVQLVTASDSLSHFFMCHNDTVPVAVIYLLMEAVCERSQLDCQAVTADE